MYYILLNMDPNHESVVTTFPYKREGEEKPTNYVIAIQKKPETAPAVEEITTDSRETPAEAAAEAPAVVRPEEIQSVVSKELVKDGEVDDAADNEPVDDGNANQGNADGEGEQVVDGEGNPVKSDNVNPDKVDGGKKRKTSKRKTKKGKKVGKKKTMKRRKGSRKGKGRKHK